VRILTKPRPARQALAAALALGLLGTSCRHRAFLPHTGGHASTEDVLNFVAAYDRMLPGDPLCESLIRYFEEGTAGLAAYRHKFSFGQTTLCEAIKKYPERYSTIHERLSSLDSAGSRISDVFAKFRVIYPEWEPPAVYLLVGSGVAAGTTVGGSIPVILIGVELHHSADQIPQTVAHEVVHTQQRYPWIGSMTGGPGIIKFMRGTLLRQSITEGSADFIAELFTGIPNRNAYGEAHEAELWTEFQKDMQAKSYGRWLFNGQSAARGDWPPNLGSYMGYVITKSYYSRVKDKPAAIRQILNIRDFDQFLVESGYHGSH